MGDAAALSATLDLLGTLTPDVVISSAFQGDSAVHRIDAAEWPNLVDGARERLGTASVY